MIVKIPMTTITFHVPYRANEGERFFLYWHTKKAKGILPMEYDGEKQIWKGNLTLKEGPVTLFWYYGLSFPSGREEKETEPERNVFLPQDEDLNLKVFDFFRPPGDLLSLFERVPFKGVFFRRKRERVQPVNQGQDNTLIIKLPAPAVRPDSRIYLVGEGEHLGNWDPARALPLTPIDYPYWEIRLPRPLPERFEYKYLLGDKEKGVLNWEKGGNRRFSCPLEEGITVLNDFPLYPPEGLPRWAGLIVPVFSLRSRRALGVGEFLDLIPFISWAKTCGFRVIQLLPINDTQFSGSWADSYPYSIISTCALHPIYLNLDDLLPPKNPRRKEIRSVKRQLNRLSKVDYPEVVKTKMRILKEIYEDSYPSCLEGKEFTNFMEKNARWLKAYAAFSYLRDRHEGKSFDSWGTYRFGTVQVIESLNDPKSEHFPHVAFYYFLQFHLHRQLSRVVRHARKMAVVLKGDLPIGVSPFSVETWSHPEWFDHRYTVGAPPDDFTETGQNWGFPLYRWEEMEKDGYAFWRMRFEHLTRFFQAVRLDHVLGFFRIWAIPKKEKSAVLGRFIPSLPYSSSELASMGIENPWEWLKTGSGRKAGQRKDDVIFITEEREGHPFFHPRFQLEKTRLFFHLPQEKKALLINLCQDYFYRRHNRLWQETGEKRLRALLNLTGSLLCAEDLGLVPEVVPPTLARLGILSLRIERMPTRPGEIFAHLSAYPYLSVASPGTHDMSPLRLWWQEEDRAKIQYYYEHILNEKGIAPVACPEGIIEKIIFRHLSCPSIFALFLIQDILALESRYRKGDPSSERINDPAIKNYKWSYRQPVAIEDLKKDRSFSEKIRLMIGRSGREV